MKAFFFRYRSPKRRLGLIGSRAATFTAAVAVLAVASTVLSPAAAAAKPGGTDITATGISDLTQLSAAEMAAATPAIPATTASPGSGLSTLLAYDPWTNPRARDIRETNSSPPSCYTDYVCQKVPKTANCPTCGMREFLFFDYGLYSVFDWHENGKYINRQRAGASYRTYRSNGSQIGCAWPGRAGTNVLEPIFYVLLSPTPC